jgi:pimeloyl-ACP methyl ester carboxylesterase
MENPRKYGRAPYAVAVIHGGPGGGGEMAPVARARAQTWSVLEPIQTATSIEGQIEELRTLLGGHGHPPYTLIGHSWGAWLGYLLAAHHPALVKKLILVGSGGFRACYAADLDLIRLSRLTEDERAEIESLRQVLADPESEGQDAAFARFGKLYGKADAYDPLPQDDDEEQTFPPRADIYHSVWPAAAQMRSNGELLALGVRIKCPVVAIHGEYDSHPAEGVREPLSSVLPDFRFHLLERCGHTPWMERQARDEFYHLLGQELE